MKGPALVLLCLFPAIVLASDRKVVASRAGCEISVGDRDHRGTDKVIADCVWPVKPEAVIAVVGKPETHAFLSSVEESTRLPDGRVLQVHAASGISDRQITLDFTNMPLPNGGFRTEWRGSAKQEPLRDGLVAAEVDDGAWEVHAEGSGSRVVYELRYNAGGSVPEWVVRAFQKTGVGELVEEMRKKVGG
jgi:hypothetical protein